MSLWFGQSFNLDVIDAIYCRTMNRAINVLLFSSDPFVAYLHIAYVLSVVCLVHRDAVVCRIQG